MAVVFTCFSSAVFVAWPGITLLSCKNKRPFDSIVGALVFGWRLLSRSNFLPLEEDVSQGKQEDCSGNESGELRPDQKQALS